MDDSVKLARELARIAKDNELAELEYRSGQTLIRLVLEAPPVAVAERWVSQEASSVAPPAAAPAPPAPSAPASTGHFIRSPLAGVFYRAPRPGAPPFVEVGQQVSTEQTLCIIEAMKQMNAISAEAQAPCRISKILVENAAVVEPGQALFEIEPLA